MAARKDLRDIAEEGSSEEYWASHRSRCREHGSAGRRVCVDCGGRAKHWSYNYTGAPKVTEESVLYTTDFADYSPRCFRCHMAFDLEMDPRVRDALSEGGKKTIRVMLEKRKQNPSWLASRKKPRKPVAAARREEMSRVASERLRKQWEDPEFAEKMKTASSVNGKIQGSRRRQCVECGRILPPGPMGSHQKASGHAGVTDLPSTDTVT